MNNLPIHGRNTPREDELPKCTTRQGLGDNVQSCRAGGCISQGDLMEDFDGSILKAMDAELVTQHPQADQFLARDSAVFVFLAGLT
jgi:hypothetical protein